MMLRAFVFMVIVTSLAGNPAQSPFPSKGEAAAEPIKPDNQDLVYGGKRLSEWVRLMNQNPGDHQAVARLGEMGEIAIPYLIEAMRSHPDGAIRWLTHVALAKIGPAALPELDRVMVDGNPGARMQAVLSFEEMLGSEAIPRLTEATRDEDAGVRVRSHGALLRLGQPAEQHLPPILQVLKEGEQNHPWLAAEAIGQSGAKAAGAEEALAEALRSPSKSVADRALRALEEIGSERAAEYVLRERVRRMTLPGAKTSEKVSGAVEMVRLGKEGAYAVPALTKVAAATDEDILARGYAAWALEQINPRPAEEPGRVYHVGQAHPMADDSGPGTADRPWKTIQKAAETLRPGDTVLIHEGVYRECVRPFLGGTGPERMVSYLAALGEAPVLKGSDVWEPLWTDEGDGLWSTPYERHPWDAPESWPEPKKGPMHRAEQIFMDGALLKHVGTKKELDRVENSFATDDEAGRLWIHVDGAEPPSERLIERSMRQQVFAPAVRGLGYIRVQGLTMRHAAAPESNGANWHAIGHRAVMSVRTGHHWIIEDNTIEWGNAQGLDIGTEGWGKDLADQPVVTDERGHHQVRRNRVNCHGVAGIVGWGNGQQYLLLEDNITNFNCQKGNLYQYEAAGVKIHRAEDCVIRRHVSHGNRSFGIWLDHRCLRNRVTQCLLTENTAAGLFFEVSAGPLLADNNVILRTREAPRGNWGEGIYSHDGNHATYINNYIEGCDTYGVRLRNIFSRVSDGSPTTTSHNRVFNNFLFDNGRGPVSLNPEVRKAEDNVSDHNIVWQAGRPIAMRFEDAGSGVVWEKTAIGRVLDATAGGDLIVPFHHWRQVAGQDEKSLPVSPALLFGDRDPEAIRDVLIDLWPEEAPALDGGYEWVKPQEAESIVGALRPQLRGARFIRSIQLGPSSGALIWAKEERVLCSRWTDGGITDVEPLHTDVLANDPIPGKDQARRLAAGDNTIIEIPKKAEVLFAGLQAEIENHELKVSVPAKSQPGEYAVVIENRQGWQPILFQVVEGYSLIGVEPILDSEGTAVIVSVTNNKKDAVQAELTAAFEENTFRREAPLPPREAAQVKIPVEAAGVHRIKVEVRLPEILLEQEVLASFARAVPSPRWDAVPRYEMETFPGGVFPEGAEAFVLFKGGLSATWSARYDDEAIHLRVEVQDDTHLQKQPLETIWKEDSIQFRILSAPEATPLEIDVALPSSGGEPIVYRRLSPDESRFPVGRADDTQAKVARQEHMTTYQVKIPWEMIGLQKVPESGTSLPFSLLVNDEDGAGRHGLQWFFGIHTHRNDESKMGRLWIE